MEMKIGVDFDRVLFDTEQFKKYLEDEIPGFLDTYGLATGKGYDPEKHADIMDIPSEKIYDTLDYEQGSFIYDDVDQLEGWNEEHDVVIISRGDPEFQSTKIENADLGFSYYIVTGEAEDNPKQFGEGTQHPEEEPLDFLVDDRDYEHENFGGPGYHLQREEDSLENVLDARLEPINLQPGDRK